MKTIAKFIVMFVALLFNVQLFAQTDNIAVVSADKMNVFYIGIDNPVSIAVPGISGDKLKVSINNGTISGSNGKYIVKVDKVMETIIEVTVEIKPGDVKKVGSNVFRVKRIPDPIPCICNHCNIAVYISKEELLRDPTISISLNLPFDLKFDVVSFSATFNFKGELKSVAIIGNKFNQEIIDLVKQLDNSQKMFIEDIKVKGPDGTRNLQPISIIFVDDNKIIKE
jgi:gliding motility-associated protein GldM